MREIVIGLLGGTLIGATGIGSGSLLTPLLILAGYEPSVAVGTGLATLIVSKLAAKLSKASGERAEPRMLFLAGVIVSGFVILTSAGSSRLLVPLLLAIVAWGVPQLATTNNLFGWIVALVSFALYVGSQSFDAHLFLLVLIGLAPGVAAGVFLSPWIERRSFAPALSLFTLYLAVQLI